MCAIGKNQKNENSIDFSRLLKSRDNRKFFRWKIKIFNKLGNVQKGFKNAIDFNGTLGETVTFLCLNGLFLAPQRNSCVGQVGASAINSAAPAQLGALRMRSSATLFPPSNAQNSFYARYYARFLSYYYCYDYCLRAKNW